MREVSFLFLSQVYIYDSDRLPPSTRPLSLLLSNSIIPVSTDVESISRPRENGLHIENYIVILTTEDLSTFFRCIQDP